MNKKQYKIVYCTPALYSSGGTERAVTVKANYFADVLEYDVTIIVTEGNGSNSFFTLSRRVKIVNLGLHFEDFWYIPFTKKVCSYLQKQRKYQKLLEKELQRIKPDVTISTLRREINFINAIEDGSCKIGELHLSRDNYREVNNKRSNIVIWLFSKWWKKKIVSHLKALDNMVVLTGNAVSEWPELTNVRMIPDPLPFISDNFAPLNAKRIIAVGRYSYEKGYDLLLKIWAIVEKEFLDWELDIYAMGDPTPYVKLIDELSIDKKRCHLNSSVVDVEDVYMKSSILVQPSRTEGFGLVIVEAMSCGLPVVSFDCENGPRSIITNGEDGFLIPPFDIDMFANFLMRLMSDDDLRKSMGEKGKQNSRRYNIDIVGQQWKQLFDELMENR